jgi:hypothetical protein
MLHMQVVEAQEILSIKEMQAMVGVVEDMRRTAQLVS